MTRLIRNLLLIVILILLLPSYLSSTTRGISVVSREGQSVFLYKDYHAIVIGVSDYDYWPKLPNAVNDAKEVGAKLEELGFKVNLITNPDSRKLKSTLSDMARRLGAEKNRALLFYFAGHGETTELADGTELGFIIPKDCPLQNLDPYGFDSRAVSMKDVEMLALRVKSKHMLMLFDSCFSGSLFALARAAPTDITEKSAKPVRQFITAGGADETVPDQSIFKVVLFRGLEGEADFNRDRYVTGSELGMYLQSKVVNYSRGAQHPQYGKINNPHLDRGDFIFVPKAAKGLKVEKQLPEEETPKLAYIPKSVPSAKVSLRKEPRLLREPTIEKMVLRHNFYDSLKNTLGSFKNDFLDNGDGTITDRTTGLMWQKGGSTKSISRRRANTYVSMLNRDKVAGYRNWRLPTIEELATLLESTDTNGVHIDPMFENRQRRCWSSDKAPSTTDVGYEFEQGWVVSFAEGGVRIARWYSGFTGGFRMINPSNWAKAVRSVK